MSVAHRFFALLFSNADILTRRVAMDPSDCKLSLLYTDAC